MSFSARSCCFSESKKYLSRWSCISCSEGAAPSIPCSDCKWTFSSTFDILSSTFFILSSKSAIFSAQDLK
jgi:hypothetical protein